MRRHYRRFAGLVALLMIGTLLAACGETAAPSAPTPAANTDSVEDLTIIWAQWSPSDYLQQLVKDYKNVAGITVKVIQEPWGTFGDRFFSEMAAKGTSYDLVVGDSQWLGQGATNGWYVELTDAMNNGLNGKALSPLTVMAYAEYPKGSGKYWAYPTQGDATGWAYRKDLFEDPAEKMAFKTTYGYDLDVPDTWAHLKDIAEFFTRPDKNLYGLSIYTQKDYDAITMGYENVLFSWGGDWGDYSSYKVNGILNSKESIEALDFYKSLYKYVPPGSSNDFSQEVNNHYTSGQIAMAMNYFAFFPALANKASNPYADKTGYFSNPKGPTGKSFAALGGQGMSIVKYISPARQKAAMDFLKWFASDPVQVKWADMGGYTCNTNVLKSDKFLKATPYNQAFADTMRKIKDYWAVPVYSEMLKDTQEGLHNFIVADMGSAKDTLDAITHKNEATLKKAGLLK